MALLVFGIPSIFLLQKFHRLNLLWLVIVFATVGIVVIFLLAGAIRIPIFDKATYIPRIVIGATVATGVAIAYWYISGHNTSLNPDAQHGAPVNSSLAGQ